ncbi:putative LysR family transcriptional regulator [Actinacidiphila reveromycinica]|uniref:HTH-type transcriptional regulator LysG n=1 Tax=Actinacidiphila reveromycinica TaxID=659352 RepID=A0A7U3WGY8_9ACTN|nr:LysR family transcriptional regulator ArgP [Streptomyces sp. SN-593]BBA95835.1 putative LysR family transcriptional regulator [Streptomyces sp. SN-593]
MPGLPLDQVRTLLAAVDEGTFEAAAEALHVTPSAVSQRVKALEQRTGRVLLLRTKPVRPTPSGEVVIRFGRQLARLELDAGAELGLGDALGPATLPIAVNADSLATWFLPALAEAAADRDVLFDLHRDDEDHTAALLRQGRVMAAVTSSPHAVQGCSVRALGRMRYRAMAAPRFVARWLAGRPLREALPDAPAIVFDRKDELQDRFLRGLAPRRARAATRARHCMPSSEAFLDAVAAGLGWGMIPDMQAGPHLAAGTLVELAARRPVDVPLYWQQWKLDSPDLAAVAEAVYGAAARELAPPVPEPPPARRGGRGPTGPGAAAG